MEKLHIRKTFKPVITSELPRKNKEKLLEYLIFMKEIKDRAIKGRACVDRRKQCKYSEKGKFTSDMVSI